MAVLRPPLAWLTSQDWSGEEYLPPHGGFIVAVNHLSEIDPFTVAHFLVDHGCPPMFLAKSSLFDIPVLGRALRPLGQVPVYRNSRRAGEALAEAEEAVSSGKCVVIMPEGTLTREPSLWPMRGRTGVGRLALATRAPVIPIGQWGPQRLLAPYARRPTGLLSRPTMQIKAGPPVELSDLYGRAGERSAMAEASDRVMRAVVDEVAVLRGETPPAQLYERPRGTGAGSGS